jgi:hypothetical protein
MLRISWFIFVPIDPARLFVVKELFVRQAIMVN